MTGKRAAFRVLDQSVAIDCDDEALGTLLVSVTRGMPVAEGMCASLRYSAAVVRDPPAFMLARNGGPTLTADDAAGFLFLLEKDLTVELQKRRPDLLFLHSAALAWRGRGVLLVAESGEGKSTTAWALLHDGFRYLSDELAPIDLAAMTVLPYPHALCLKQIPAEYALPREALDLGATTHIPPHMLPGGAIRDPKPLAAIFILAASSGPGASALRALGPAEAAARLYTHVLNALAHPNRGLDVVLRVAERVPCFALARGELRAMSGLVRGALESCDLSCRGGAATFGFDRPSR